jgi:hypothetical protein
MFIIFYVLINCFAFLKLFLFLCFLVLYICFLFYAFLYIFKCIASLRVRKEVRNYGPYFIATK